MNYIPVNDYILIKKQEKVNNSPFVVVDSKSTLERGEVLENSTFEIQEINQVFEYKKGDIILYQKNSSVDIENDIAVVRFSGVVCKVKGE